MANQLFDFGREGFLDGQISWTQNTIRAILVDTAAYTVNKATHQWLSDVAAEARVATSSPLTGKTITGGVAGADAASFTSVTGPACEALILYRDTGTASTSRLIAYIDQAVGLPLTPSGGNVSVTWDTNTTKRIFKL